MRLLDKAEEIGIISNERIAYLKRCKENVFTAVETIKNMNISMKDANKILEFKNLDKD